MLNRSRRGFLVLLTDRVRWIHQARKTRIPGPMSLKRAGAPAGEGSVRWMVIRTTKELLWTRQGQGQGKAVYITREAASEECDYLNGAFLPSHSRIAVPFGHSRAAALGCGTCA